MSDLKELYEKETGKKWCFGYTCGREYLFLETTEYKNWLEQKAEEGAASAIQWAKIAGKAQAQCEKLADRIEELEQKAEEGQKAIAAMNEILRLSKQLVYDEAFGGCVRKVIQKWEESNGT